MDIEKKYMQNSHMQGLRSDILKQIEDEKAKKARKSTFEYHNIGRHNPITNPIEYHIDNPYILKRIQDKSVR